MLCLDIVKMPNKHLNSPKNLEFYGKFLDGSGFIGLKQFSTYFYTDADTDIMDLTVSISVKG